MNAAEMLRRGLIELAAAFALLTRLPVHRLRLPRLTVPAEAVWAYPIVGAAVGAGIMSLPALQGALAAQHGSPVAGAAVAVMAPLGKRLVKAVSPT